MLEEYLLLTLVKYSVLTLLLIALTSCKEQKEEKTDETDPPAGYVPVYNRDGQGHWEVSDFSSSPDFYRPHCWNGEQVFFWSGKNADTTQRAIKARIYSKEARLIRP